MWNRIKGGDPIIVAGIAGSMVALYYTRPLCWPKALCAAIGGTGAAVFISPAFAIQLPLEFGPAISFLLGVFSMSLIGVVFQVIERIKETPITTLSEMANIIIDVLLAFRNGVHNRKKEDNTNGN